LSVSYLLHCARYKVAKRKKDSRPICRCTSYKFPHKIGGKCTGIDFVELYFYHIKELCEYCNCNINRSGQCDVIVGSEHIREAECLLDAQDTYSGAYLPIFIEDIL
jgi:hypothetical protein